MKIINSSKKMQNSITIFGKEFKIYQSAYKNWYFEPILYKYLNIDNPKEFAKKFGDLSPAEIPSFKKTTEFEHFVKFLESINNLPAELWYSLYFKPHIGQFLHNIETEIIPNWKCISPHEVISIAFIWHKTKEGKKYWEDIHNNLVNEHEENTINNLTNNENRLQEQEIDRSRSNRSERNRLRCGGDRTESSTRYSSHQATARKCKDESGCSKIYISTRSGRVHRR